MPKRLEGSNPFSRIGTCTGYRATTGTGTVQRRAGIAQLVELHLAKVDVAGSSPVSRSSSFGLQGAFYHNRYWMSLWECPKCGRKFDRRNQRHACGTGDRNELLRGRAQPVVVTYLALEEFAPMSRA